MNNSIFRLFFTLFLISISIESYSQVSDSLFNEICKHEDIVILEEDINVNITGQKILYMLANITERKVLTIKTEEGLSSISSIVLPQRIDDQFISHSTSVRNMDWSYDNVYIKSFTVTDFNSGAEFNTIHKVQSQRTLDIQGFFGTVEEHIYTIENLNVGDTIEIVYSYNIPFIDNWIKLLSNRIFFHGEYPSKSFKLKWCYNAGLVVDSLWVNLDPPAVTMEGNQLCYNWSLKNLPGSLDEPGSRPYMELPHLIFLPKSYDLEYTHFNSYKMEFIPSYLFAANDLQTKLYNEYWDNIIGAKDKSNLAYEKLANKFEKMSLNDTIGWTKMRLFQRYMVDSVRYDPAIEYYKKNENHLRELSGVDLQAGFVDDNNLERVYANMIPKLGLDMFSAYPVDNRVGEISNHYNSTVKENDLLFAVAMKDNTIGFVVPRTDKNYYYFEELPFYYENIPVLLIHVQDYGDIIRKRNIYTDFRSIVTPGSQWKDNYRKTQSMVNVNLNKEDIKFATRLSLSGQYSTLTRNLYLELPADSTINPKYNDEIWNIAADVKLNKINAQNKNVYYPFATSIMMDYQSVKLIHKENDDYVFEAGSLFKPVYWELDENQPRTLDFYTDFVGSDQYSYMLNFDEPVDLTGKPSDVNIKNDYASVIYRIQQTAPASVLITLNYDIITKKVNSSDIELVLEINKALKEIMNSKLVFKVKK